ncbi:MAG: TatD DNase family protein [Cyclobacteriaceae bacterium]|jgi:TatD DNase family protein
MIDSHAHVYDDGLLENIDAIMSESRALGVTKLLMPNIDHESIEAMLALEDRFPDYCLPMMGLHPCSVDKHFEKALYEVEEWLDKRPFIAVGEMGTDLYWDKQYWPQQQEAFRIQCQLALKHKLPIVIHSRESIDETIQLVTPYVEQGLTGVFHCFTGTVEQAHKIKSLGFYLGIGGVLTFKNSGLDAVIRAIGSDRLLLETDSPYLAPAPNRGKKNSPIYLPLIAQKLADTLEVRLDEISDITSNHAVSLFQLDEL